MFHELKHALKRAPLLIRYAPAAGFAAIGGFMNYEYAATLGSTYATQLAWQAVAICSALYTAMAPGFIASAYNSGQWARLLSAVAVLAPTLTYDALAAYGFATREYAVVAAAVEEPAKRYREALADLKRAENDLQPYLGAIELGAAQDKVASLKGQLQVGCAAAKTDYSRGLCEKYRTAEEDLANAKAKARLLAAVESARVKAREAEPPVAPADARAEVLGAAVVQWLPVVLLTLGAFLGFFAVPSAAPAVGEPRLKRIQPIFEESEPIAQPSAELPATNGVFHTPLGDPIAALRAIAANPGALPYGVRMDRQGRLCGTQRGLARAVGKPTTAVNRALKAAARSKCVDVDTAGNITAIRFLN